MHLKGNTYSTSETVSWKLEDLQQHWSIVQPLVIANEEVFDYQLCYLHYIHNYNCEGVNPCGVPVLRVMVENVWGPSLTARGRSVMKSWIQLMSCELRPNWWSFMVSLPGITVLKAEL